MRKIYKNIILVGFVVALAFVFFLGLPIGDATIIQSSQSSDEVSRASEITICTMVKNEQPHVADYLVEVGILPTDVAQSWFGNGLSIWNSDSPGECCVGQQNIADEFITLGPYEERRVCQRVRVPYNGIQDYCGNAEYYSGTGIYKTFSMVSNKCHYEEGVEQSGFELYDVQLQNIMVI